MSDPNTSSGNVPDIDMDGGRSHGKRLKGTFQRCGAKAHHGGTCKNPALANGRCRFHGGHHASGPMAPNWKTGRYSKWMPVRLAQRYDEARYDPELTSLIDELAVVDSRIKDLLEQLGQNEGPALWEALREAHRRMVDARDVKNTRLMQRYLNEMDRLIERGAQESALWSEITSQIDQRRRLAEAESKRLATLKQIITVQGAVALLGAIALLIKGQVEQHVSDPATARALLVGVSAGLENLATQEPF